MQGTILNIVMVLMMAVLVLLVFLQKREFQAFVSLSKEKNTMLQNELWRLIAENGRKQELLVSQKMQEASDAQFRKFNVTQQLIDEKLRQSYEQSNKKLDDMAEKLEHRLSLIQRNSAESAEKTRDTLDSKLKEMRSSNEKRLDEMRLVVEEKLEATLKNRLTESFKAVSTSLESVQKGLGEMQGLAKDARDLKNVLSNVKQRGIIGEVLLGALIEDILAPSQYEENAEIESGKRVEFVVKLPGSGEDPVLLPIDSKFPDAAYQRLLESTDRDSADKARKELYSTVKAFAKDISEKYIAPPKTTDFAIMFLPTEGLYAEIVKNTALFEELRRDYKVVVTGATTLSALLSSLKIGFQTLAIEKRSAEVWDTLGRVKKEFGKFAGQLDKAHKDIQKAEKTIATLSGTRARAMERVLRGVEEVDVEEKAVEQKNGEAADVRNPSFSLDDEVLV